MPKGDDALRLGVKAACLVADKTEDPCEKRASALVEASNNAL